MPDTLIPHAAQPADRIRLARFSDPQQWVIGYTDDGEPIHDDCVRCQQPEAVMAGAVVGPNGQVVARLNDDGLTCHNMLYCLDCGIAVEARWKWEGAVKVNHELKKGALPCSAQIVNRSA